MSKLYCTATSEKASKGQGGNNFIEIVATIDEGERKAITIQIWTEEDKTFLKYLDCLGNEIYEDITKGKRQKGDTMTECIKCHYNYNKGYYKKCPSCNI